MQRMTVRIFDVAIFFYQLFVFDKLTPIQSSTMLQRSTIVFQPSMTHQQSATTTIDDTATLTCAAYVVTLRNRNIKKPHKRMLLKSRKRRR
jgi:hypothetical protein